MFDAIVAGFFMVFQWPALGYLFLGIMIGLWIGVVPGLGGVVGLVLLLPFTYGMEPVSAFALLLGMFTVTTTSDTVASVLLGVPGTAASAATIMDGYPMAKKGQAGRALGAAFTVSAIGGVVGAIILALSFPLAVPVLEKVGSPEIFMFGLLALTMVASLSGDSVLKGLSAALLGLLLSTVGYSEIDAIPRYWFGSDYLIDGLPLIPVIMGLFAVPAIMDLALRNISISEVPKGEAEGGGLLDGVKDVWTHKWLAIRCALMGTYLGILPGIGAVITDWLAYGHAVQSAKDKSKFGHGDVRGVIAPEAANNANKGGALVPTVALGIPGNLGCAILMSALLIQGLKPGPNMLIDNLDITFSIVWTVAVANVVAALLMMVWSKQVAKLAFVPGHIIIPGICLFVFMGAWMGEASLADWISLVVFGALGYVMHKCSWPRPPLILAFILGSIVENAFQLSMLAHDGLGWLARPVVMVCAALIILTLFVSIRRILRGKKEARLVASQEDTKNDEEKTKGSAKEKQNQVLSLPLAIILAVVFVGGTILSLEWPRSANEFPLTICIPAAIIMFLIIVVDLLDVRRALDKFDNLAMFIHEASERAYIRRAVMFLGYMIGVILVSMLIGQKITLPLFIGIYLIRWGKYSWKWALLYSIFGYIFLVGFYDRAMNLLWYPSLLSNYLPSLLPSWLPPWLFV